MHKDVITRVYTVDSMCVCYQGSACCGGLTIIESFKALWSTYAECLCGYRVSFEGRKKSVLCMH